MFLCETKKKKAFVEIVFKKLKGITRYEVVDPKGLSGGLTIGWPDNVTVRQVIAIGFCFEVELEDPGS